MTRDGRRVATCWVHGEDEVLLPLERRFRAWSRRARSSSLGVGLITIGLAVTVAIILHAGPWLPAGWLAVVVFAAWCSHLAADFDHPSLAEMLPNGNVLLNDDRRPRVVVIDPHTNQIVWQYGVTDTPGKAAGMLNVPDGVDVDYWRDWQGWPTGG